jgi:hypothetical protein
VFFSRGSSLYVFGFMFIFHLCFVLDLVISWSRSGRVLVLFLGLFSLGGPGLFLIPRVLVLFLVLFFDPSLV